MIKRRPNKNGVIRHLIFITLLIWFYSIGPAETLAPEEDKLIINAQNQIVCDEIKHQCTATGQAEAEKGKFKIFADVLMVFYTGDKKREIEAITAEGHVKMVSLAKEAFGDYAHYDAKLDRIRLTGKHLQMRSENGIFTAKDSIEYWREKQEGIAKGDAVARFPEKKQLVQADTLYAYFKPVASAPAAEKKDTATHTEKLEIDRVVALGNVLVSQPSEIITGDKGIYYANTEIAEMTGNVRATQEGNQIEGAYAKAHLKTKLVEMFSSSPYDKKPTKQRIRGFIIPKNAKETKKKRDKALENKE